MCEFHRPLNRSILYRPSKSGSCFVFFILTLMLVACTNPAYSQKGKQPVSKSAPKQYRYTWKVDGKTVNIVCDKPLPITSIGNTYRDAALVPQLRKALADTYQSAVRFEGLFRTVSLELEAIKSSVSQKEDEIRELRDEKDEISRQYKLVDIEFDYLKREVSNFSFYDWKLIVPEVDRKLRRLEGELDDLQRLIDN